MRFIEHLRVFNVRICFFTGPYSFGSKNFTHANMSMEISKMNRSFLQAYKVMNVVIELFYKISQHLTFEEATYCGELPMFG